MAHSAALPFTLHRSDDVIGRDGIVSTRETVYGLLRVAENELIVQWRASRQTERVGAEIRTDQEIDAVREVVVPLEGVPGAVVRRRWWWPWRSSLRLVLTAADLRAFEEITNAQGLRSAHPAELVLRLRAGDRIAAEEFTAELSLAVAELAARASSDPPRTPPAAQTAEITGNARPLNE